MGHAGVGGRDDFRDDPHFSSIHHRGGRHSLWIEQGLGKLQDEASAPGSSTWMCPWEHKQLWHPLMEVPRIPSCSEHLIPIQVPPAACLYPPFPPLLPYGLPRAVLIPMPFAPCRKFAHGNPSCSMGWLWPRGRNEAGKASREREKPPGKLLYCLAFGLLPPELPLHPWGRTRSPVRAPSGSARMGLFMMGIES